MGKPGAARLVEIVGPSISIDGSEFPWYIDPAIRIETSRTTGTVVWVGLLTEHATVITPGDDRG